MCRALARLVRVGDCGTPLCTSDPDSTSLLRGPAELTVIRLVETHFSKHQGNQFYDPHFKHI